MACEYLAFVDVTTSVDKSRLKVFSFSESNFKSFLASLVLDIGANPKLKSLSDAGVWDGRKRDTRT